jgi:hypothetical protein
MALSRPCVNADDVSPTDKSSFIPQVELKVRAAAVAGVAVVAPTGACVHDLAHN